MSGVKHTPGPWKVVRGELVGANGRRVVEYGSGCAFMCGGPDEESVANAQLRNAAPDLLEAADAAMRFYDALGDDHRPGECKVLDNLAKAITRATGDRPEKGGA